MMTTGQPQLEQPVAARQTTAPRKRRLLRRVVLLALVLFYVLPVLVQAVVYLATGPHEHWSRADRSSIGIAPVAAQTPEAVVQVYSARTHGWRSIFATHTWFALKPAHATDWERFEVIGFGVNRGRPAVRASSGLPDTRWYGHDPVILAELRGAPAEAAIGRLRAAAAAYPYPKSYTAWPGPNSNTFIAHLARIVPELRLDLPASAIGKNYPVDGFLCRTPSGTGWQFTLGGFAGIAVGLEEGIEIDLLGAVAGIDVKPLALRLPGIGRLW
jgi:hypothetical protein